MSFTSGAADASAKPQPATGRETRRQGGILGDGTDPNSDSQVILACAVVGHTVSRLGKGLQVRYDMEGYESITDKSSSKKEEWDKEVKALQGVVKKINRSASAWTKFGKPPSAMAEAGFTPVWTEDNDNRIVGSVRNNDPSDKSWDSMRFDPPLPSDVAGDQLYKFVKQQRPNITLGYQGSGAYTGFVQGREGGQSTAYSSYRHIIPGDQPRWHPSKDVLGAIALPTDVPKLPPKQAYWGMLLSYNDEIDDLQNKQNMYLQDLDARRQWFPSAGRSSIFGYTHGMIQAIYDVERQKLSGSKKPGVPYEIAVGQKTCKLGSCFCCAIFMEGAGYPASAVHLGRADSWAPMYPESLAVGAPLDPASQRNKACSDTNRKWEIYCKEIIDTGLACNKAFIADDKLASFDALGKYVQGKDALWYAGLILDAVTIHGSIYKAVDGALKPDA